MIAVIFELAPKLGQAQRYFALYRLRVAQVIRDYGLSDRAQAPADSLGACVDGLG